MERNYKEKVGPVDSVTSTLFGVEWSASCCESFTPRGKYCLVSSE